MSTVLEQIEQQIARLQAGTVKKNVGAIRTVADGVALCDGLSEVMYNEMVEFPGGVIGIALNLTEDDVGCVVLGDVSQLKQGDPVKTTGRLLSVPVGKAPYGAALADGGALLYVTNQHEDTVTVIDARSLAVLRTLSGFGYPEGIASHGNSVYVVNWMDDRVSVLDARTGQLTAQIATGTNSRGFGAFIGAPP